MRATRQGALESASPSARCAACRLLQRDGGPSIIGGRHRSTRARTPTHETRRPLLARRSLFSPLFYFLLAYIYVYSYTFIYKCDSLQPFLVSVFSCARFDVACVTSAFRIDLVSTVGRKKRRLIFSFFLLFLFFGGALFCWSFFTRPTGFPSFVRNE